MLTPAHGLHLQWRKRACEEKTRTGGYPMELEQIPALIHLRAQMRSEVDPNCFAGTRRQPPSHCVRYSQKSHSRYDSSADHTFYHCFILSIKKSLELKPSKPGEKSGDSGVRAREAKSGQSRLHQA